LSLLELGSDRTSKYVPCEGSDIFESRCWSRHSPVVGFGVGASGGLGRKKHFGTEFSFERGEGKGRGAVIDCGPARAGLRSDEEGGLVTLPGSELQAQQQQAEFPTPRPVNIQRDLRTARKDWRFGRVRIESLDLDLDLDAKGDGMESTRPHLRRRGESSSAGAGPAGNGISAGLSAATSGVGVGVGGGRVTKARFDAVEWKNTEVGWGIVHLYRDGDETLGLGAPPKEEIYAADDTDGKEVEEDCTVLCIPAVPSYLTPSDFLGFVGEKTREQVSHFRMVMTGRMNRYLVLMKFRDGRVARKWKMEWDGKVFNSMEVILPLQSLETARLTIF
jgi:BRCA1-associated protein